MPGRGGGAGWLEGRQALETRAAGSQPCPLPAQPPPGRGAAAAGTPPPPAPFPCCRRARPRRSAGGEAGGGSRRFPPPPRRARSRRPAGFRRAEVVRVPAGTERSGRREGGGPASLPARPPRRRRGCSARRGKAGSVRRGCSQPEAAPRAGGTEYGPPGAGCLAETTGPATWLGRRHASCLKSPVGACVPRS